MENQKIQFKRTTPLIRMVGSLLCALIVSLAALTARAQTATVIDPQGDAFYSNGHKAPAFLDILVASITISDTLTLTVDVAGPLHSLPNPPDSGGVFFWNFPLNTDPSTDPPGFPEAPGSKASAEFAVYAQWDGTAFSGVFVDRRPALTGGSAVHYSIPVSVSGSRITFAVPAALAALVQPLPGATWNCDTGWTNTALFGIGTDANHIADAIGRQPWPQ
jgi:hypothetical protein